MPVQKVCWLCDEHINNQDKINIESIANGEWLKNAIKNKIKNTKKAIRVANYDIYIYDEKFVHCSCVDKMDKSLRKLCGDSS